MRKKRKIVTYVALRTFMFIETIKTGDMSTENLNKTEIKHKATHKRTQHNANKLVHRHLHSPSVPFSVHFLFKV